MEDTNEEELPPPEEQAEPDIEAVRERIKELTPRVEETSMDIGSIALIRAELLKEIQADMKTLVSELVRIRAALEEVDPDEAMGTTNERAQEYFARVHLDFLTKILSHGTQKQEDPKEE